MDSCKLIFVLTCILCDTKVSHQSLWPHAQSIMQEGRRDEKVCQSFDMCATLNGICNYGKCETHKCASEIHCVCNKGYTGHRCDIGDDDIKIDDSNKSKTSNPLHEASSSGQLKDLTDTTTIPSHVQTLTTPVPESQIKNNSSFQTITTESSRKELLEAWNATMGSETKADNANTKLVDDVTNIPSIKSFSELYYDHDKGHYMKTITTQHHFQNASFAGPTTGNGHSNYSETTTAYNDSEHSNYSENTTAYNDNVPYNYSENTTAYTDNVHSNYSENTTANNDSGHFNYSENTTANNDSGHSNYSENTTANNDNVHSNYSENTTANNDSGHFNYSENKTAYNDNVHYNYSENTTANNDSGHFNYSENTTANNDSGHSNYSENTKTNNNSGHYNYSENTKTNNDSRHFNYSENTTANNDSVHSNYIENTTANNDSGHFNYSENTKTNNDSGHYNYSENTTARSDSVHSNYSENTTANNDSEHSNYSENTAANNDSEHSNYSENTTAKNDSEHSNYSENTTANNDSEHSNYSENTTANNDSEHSNYSENTTANNDSRHFNYSENTTAKPFNDVIQVQITKSLLTDPYVHESTHLEFTTNQPISRDSDGVDNRSINYTTIKNDVDKRYHIGATESTLTEINKETMTFVKTTNDQLSFTDSGGVDNYNTKMMTIESLDTVDKNNTIQENLSPGRTQSFGESESNDNYAAQLEVIVRNSVDTDQNSHYQSTPKDMEFGPYIETIGSTNPEDMLVTKREKMHFGSTQKLSETIDIAEHVSNGDSDQTMQSGQDTFAADKDKLVELYERNSMANMQHEKMENSEEEQDILIGSRSIEMSEDVPVHKPSFKMEDVMVKKSEMSKERPSKMIQTTVRTGYYKRVTRGRFAHTSITPGHSMTETTTPATLNDNVLDYVNRTTIQIFETNAISTGSTIPGLNDLISDRKINAISEQNPANKLFSKREQNQNISFPDLLQHSLISGSNSSEEKTIAFTTHPTKKRASDETAEFISEPVQSLNMNPSSNRTNTIDKDGVFTENTYSPSINNDILQQAQERNIHDHHIVFATPLEDMRDPLSIINGLESMSNINLTAIGSEQMTDAAFVTDMLKDLKSTPLSSERFLKNSDLDDKSVDMKLENQMSQLLQNTKMNEMHISYKNPNAERKETSPILDTTNNPMPQRQIIDLKTISSTERAEIHTDKSYKDGIAASEFIDMPLPTLASKVTTTKPSPPSVLNTISLDKSSLLDVLRRLLILEDTYLTPSQITYTTTTSKAPSTYRKIGDTPDITTTTDPITSVSVESDSHTRHSTEHGLKRAMQLKELHMRNQDRTHESSNTQHEIGNHLSKPAYIPNAIEMKDNFNMSSVLVDHQINAKTEIRESDFNDGSKHVLTNGSFTGQPTETTNGLKERNETVSLTASMNENSETYVTSFDGASIHSTIIDTFIPATTLATSVSKLNEGQNKRNILMPINMLDNLTKQARVLSSAINSQASPKLSTHLVTPMNPITIETIPVPTREHVLENESYKLDQIQSSLSYMKVRESEKDNNGQKSTPRSSDNTVNPVSTDGFPKGNDSTGLLMERITSNSIEHLNRNETENNATGSKNNDTKITSNNSDSYGIVVREIIDSVIEQKISSIKTSNAHIVSETEALRLSDIFSTLKSPRPTKVTMFTTPHSKLTPLSLMNSSKHISGEISASSGDIDNTTVQNKIKTTTINDESQTAETQINTLDYNARPHLDCGIVPIAVKQNNIDNSCMTFTLVANDFNDSSKVEKATRTLLESKDRLKRNTPTMDFKESTEKLNEQSSSNYTLVDNLNAFKLANDLKELMFDASFHEVNTFLELSKWNYIN
ncbi:hypothetical protein ACJMK2_042608 [Sinanodonta woodiana]|uniref:EGF-like domain-containing protein n=1 Tax=Sinanodonta woodiana TaxID=1069815 RepID=A0ABD3W7W2_SINWO